MEQLRPARSAGRNVTKAAELARAAFVMPGEPASRYPGSVREHQPQATVQGVLDAARASTGAFQVVERQPVDPAP